MLRLLIHRHRMQPVLDAAAGGELPPSEEEGLDVHLARCADCRDRAAWLRETDRLLAVGRAETVPKAFGTPEIADALFHQALARSGVPRRPRRRRLALALSGLALSLAAVTCALAPRLSPPLSAVATTAGPRAVPLPLITPAEPVGETRFAAASALRRMRPSAGSARGAARRHHASRHVLAQSQPIAASTLGGAPVQAADTGITQAPGGLMVIVTAGVPPRDLVVMVAGSAESSLGFAQAAALVPDFNGEMTWRRCTVTSGSLAPELELQSVGSLSRRTSATEGGS